VDSVAQRVLPPQGSLKKDVSVVKKVVALRERFEGGVFMDSTKRNFTPVLLAWYAENERDLPWRRTYEPYHIWISEIMLQQTQMDRVVGFFVRFIRRFPDIGSLAEAGEDDLLKLWEGLGYYSRARNLHKTAKILAAQGAQLPVSYPQLLLLPGIGPYTASAIMAIAFNRPYTVLDANVERFFARLLDLSTPVKVKETIALIRNQVEGLLPADQPRAFNQALMEFGALVCKPGIPNCGSCPFQEGCRALQAGTVGDRPVLPKRKETILIKMACGLVRRNGRFLIQKRHADDVWANLWEFPGGRLKEGESPEQAMIREYMEETELAVIPVQKIATVRHSYMNYRVTLHGFFCDLLPDQGEPILHVAQEARWVEMEELAHYAFPSGHRKLIAYLQGLEQGQE
jgi:A/G-specific adenine glycosylase